MKKLLLISLPIFVVIAIVFSIRSKEFTFASFLNFISNLRFDNAYNTFLKISEKLNDVVEILKGISQSSNPLEFIKNIFLVLVNIVNGLLLLMEAVVYIIADLLNNMSQIYLYLFA